MPLSFQLEKIVLVIDEETSMKKGDQLGITGLVRAIGSGGHGEK